MSGSYQTPASARKPLLSNAAYTVLKHLAATGLPALITLYFAVASIWHLSHTDQVMGTAAAINVFLGALMGYSTFTYNASDAKYDGEIQVDPTTKTATLAFNQDPSVTLEGRPSAVMKVTSTSVLGVPQTDPALDAQHLPQ